MVTTGDLVEVKSDETAVDSYALSANGTKSGYVTLIAGDGQAFTPKDEPIQMHVIKVGGPLYRGEAKVVLSDNPLAEKVTFIHTGDLAGSTKDFDYDWRMAAPEDGLPPAVSERSLINGATSQISTKNWKSVNFFILVRISGLTFFLLDKYLIVPTAPGQIKPNLRYLSFLVFFKKLLKPL